MSVKVTRKGQAGHLTFDRPVLLFVEGGDDSAFACRQIERIGPAAIDRWHIHEMAGISTGWGPAIEVALSDDWFSSGGRSIGLVADSDGDSAARFQSLASWLARSRLPVPDRAGVVASDGEMHAGVFLMPGPERQGALEELLLESVEPVRLELASGYLASVEDAGVVFRQRNKSLLQAVLAGQSRVTKTVKTGLERSDVFNLGSDVFDAFCTFLSQLGDSSIDVAR